LAGELEEEEVFKGSEVMRKGADPIVEYRVNAVPECS
jgi:hypothetical protein